MCATIGGETGHNYRSSQRTSAGTVHTIVTARNTQTARVAPDTKPSPVIQTMSDPRMRRPRSRALPSCPGTLHRAEGTWTDPDVCVHLAPATRPAPTAATRTPAAEPTASARTTSARTRPCAGRATNPQARRRRRRHRPRRQACERRRAGPAVPVSGISLPDRLVISGFSSSRFAFQDPNDPVTLRVRVERYPRPFWSPVRRLRLRRAVRRVTAAPETPTTRAASRSSRFGRPSAWSSRRHCRELLLRRGSRRELCSRVSRRVGSCR